MTYITKYGVRWPANGDPLEIEFTCIRNGGSWKHPKSGEQCGEGLFAHFMNARKLIWPHRYRHRWTDLMYQNFIENDLTVLMGCASCVAGNTRLLNPETGNQERIDDLCFNQVRPMVMTLDGPELANAPFVKGYADLFEIKLSNGSRFTATAKHRVLTENGFVRVSSLRVGQEILAYDECHPKSNLGNAPLVPWRDVRNSLRTTQGSQCDYHLGSHSYDEPLHPEACTCQCAFPSQEYARRHIPYVCCTEDDSNLKHECILLNPFAFHPSSCSALLHPCTTGSAYPSRVPSESGERAFLSFQPHGPLRPRMRQHHSFGKSSQRSKRKHCSYEVLSLETFRLSFSSPHEQTARLNQKPSRSLSNLCIQVQGKTRAFENSSRYIHQRSSFSSLLSLSNTQIVSIRYAGKDWYYDLEVPKAHHYFAEGAIHHNSQKTSHAVEFCLLNYWARPENTLIILSTVNMEKLEIGVWGECKKLWSEGRQRYDWLSGNIIDHKKALSTDNLDDDEIRDMRKGVVSRPVYVGGRWVGLGVLAGLKQDYIIYVADEAQFLQESFSLTWPHLFSNGNVKIIASGNPRHDPSDELGKTAEPQCGWSSFPEPEKTAVWETKFMGGKCINLVGTDSPNFDVPEDQPEPYPRLIGRKFANRIAHDHGPASFEFYRLVKGVMKVSFAHSRVITRQLCREHRASEQVKWRDDVQTHIYSLDPSYGGEDRCVGMPARIGIDVDGNQILEMLPYRVFKFNLQKEMEVEDQIAEILKEELETYDVPPENCFYDATGKGTIGAALARKFGHRVPVAIDSGARPTKRPVREDLFIEETVNGSPQRRLKRCDEHYSKFVSEMWFSLRYAIEANQVRGLQDDVIEEGCARVYEMSAGNKLEVEPKSDPKKKEDLKRRLGKSPDLFDAAVLICEGARQRGFKIKRLGVASDDVSDGFSWLKDRVRKHEELVRSKVLQYA